MTVLRDDNVCCVFFSKNYVSNQEIWFDLQVVPPDEWRDTLKATILNENSSLLYSIVIFMTSTNPFFLPWRTSVRFWMLELIILCCYSVTSGSGVPQKDSPVRWMWVRKPMNSRFIKVTWYLMISPPSVSCGIFSRKKIR